MKLLPREFAIEHKAIPICILGSRLVVAVEKPMTFQGRDFLSFDTGKSIVLVGASLKSINAQLEIYGEVKSAEEKFQDMQSFIANSPEEYASATLSAGSAEEELQLESAEIDVSDNSLVKLVNKMIIDAYDQGASDIHLESKSESKTLQIRFRRDGQLSSYYTLPAAYRNPVVSRLKIMCHLNIAERRRPQDGKIVFNHPKKGKIELRVATLPTAGGMEDVVMRLLSTGVVLPLDGIGLSESNYQKLQEVIHKPYGIVLVCGPTGSGKTTTLHSILREISRPEIKVWTAEDPVEMSQDDLCQVQVNPKIGLDFAAITRAFMRADPDVIMIGEMRDQETAKIALESSLTGHLVLSTLHTNGAAESVTRLLEMGMDPFIFADSILGVLAQRLAKKLCPACKASHQASESELLEMAEEFASVAGVESIDHQDPKLLVEQWRKQYGDEKGHIKIYTHVGCQKCRNSGFRGRIGLHELIITSPEIKRLIRQKAAVPDILVQSMKAGTKTLKQDGIEKVLLGETTLRQIRAACI
jgi:type II secretory ATPase GspE/PulE/Tfp pilus assembly ATPase PilB-like protein